MERALVAAPAALAARVGQPQKSAQLVGHPLDAAERQILAETAGKDVCLRTNACRLGPLDLAQLLAEIG